MAATVKRESRKAAKGNENGAQDRPHTVIEAEEAHVYATLRNVLDTFERRAIEYYAGGKTPRERARRAQRIQKEVFATIKEEFGVMDCRPPYCYCDGMCILCQLCAKKPRKQAE